MGLHTHGITLTGETSGLVAKVTSLSTSGITRDAIEISDVQGVDVGDGVIQAWREFVPGMLDPGEITGSIRFDKTMIDTFLDAIEDDPEEWTIVFPDNVVVENRSTFVCDGFLTSSCAITGEFEGDITADFKIKLTSEAVFDDQT